MYTFGDVDDIKILINLNRKEFTKTFFCKACKEGNKSKGFYTTNNNGIITHHYYKHISNSYFLHDINIFKESCKYIMNLKTRYFIWSNNQNSSDHFSFIEGNIDKTEKQTSFFNEKNLDFLFSNLSMFQNSNVKIFLTTNDQSISAIVFKLDNLILKNPTFEFQKSTLDGNCYHENIVNTLKQNRNCAVDCELTQKNYINYILSRYITCFFGGKFTQEKYISLLKDEIFSYFALKAQISNISSNILNGPVAANIIINSFQNILNLGETVFYFGVPKIQNVGKMDVFEYATTRDQKSYDIFRINPNSGELAPKLIGEKSEYGVIVESKLGKFPIVLKIELNNNRNFSEKKTYNEFQVGIVMNDLRKIIPNFVLTLGAFICPSAVMAEGFDKNNNKLCSNTSNSTNRLFIIQEKLNGVSLHRYIINTKEFNETQFINILRQILNALDIAQTYKKFVHDDLHFNNMMINNSIVYIFDFGKSFFSTRRNSTDFANDIHTIFAEIMVLFYDRKLDWVLFPKITRILNHYISNTRFFGNFPVFKFDSIEDFCEEYDGIEHSYQLLGKLYRNDEGYFLTSPKDYIPAFLNAKEVLNFL